MRFLFVSIDFGSRTLMEATMSDKITATRLGKILLDKGIITTEQLNIAIQEQQHRRQNNDASTLQVTPLGEILVELGMIDRLQLHRSLTWQSMLRRLTVAVAFCAPLMTLGSGAAASSASTSSRPSNALPITIQAENYSTMNGIRTQTTTDTGGGLNVSYIDAGDWMSYSGTSVTIPVTGSYKVTYRVASPGGGGRFSLNEAGSTVTYDTVDVPNTGDSQAWISVERYVTIPAGTHRFAISALTRGFGFNINWFKIETAGTPLPVTIQAESFSTMSGIQTEATTDGGNGLSVGYIHANDWMSYANTVINIPTAGNYKITYRIASPTGGGSFSFNEENTSITYDTVAVPSTGGSQIWVNVERTINLPAGAHRFKIIALVRGSGFNINWFKIDNMNSQTNSSSNSSRATSNASMSRQSQASSVSSLTQNVSSSRSPMQASSAASATGIRVAGAVALNWLVPNQRENNDVMDITELGGYELRYKQADQTDFSYITINDPWLTFYHFAWLEGTYVFQIAAFDKNGLYSNFISLTPR